MPRSTLYAALLLIVGCPAPAEKPASAASPAKTKFSPGPTVAEPAYLTQGTWNDGQAEVAFYRVKTPQREFDLGTYLIKHDFDPVRQSKAEGGGGVSAFKWALFFETIHGSEQNKLSYVMNAAQADLSPLKLSINSFDWCANQYQELAFTPDGKVRRLRRSDDYGNEDRSFDRRPTSYPVAMMPLVVRALDFTKSKKQTFEVVENHGKYVGVTAKLAGKEKIDTPYGKVDAEKIVVKYDDRVHWYEGGRITQNETYWRGTDPVRTIIRIEEPGKYEVSLVETVRSPYWQENVFDELKRVTKHP